MSRKILKALVLGALVLSALMSASSASAANWTSNGTSTGMPYTATAPASKIQIASPSGASAICTGVSVTGKVFGPTGPPSSGPWNGVETFAPRFTNCTIAGLAATVTSSIGQINAITYIPSNTGDDLVQLVFTITRGSCVITITVTLTTTTYNNAAGTFAILTAAQNITATWGSACDALMGTSGGGSASVAWGNTSGGNLVYTVTSTPIPTVSK